MVVFACGPAHTLAGKCHGRNQVGFLSSKSCRLNPPIKVLRIWILPPVLSLITATTFSPSRPDSIGPTSRPPPSPNRTTNPQPDPLATCGLPQPPTLGWIRMSIWLVTLAFFFSSPQRLPFFKGVSLSPDGLKVLMLCSDFNQSYNIPVLMLLCPCSCSHNPVLMFLCSCSCAGTAVLMFLFL